MRFIYSGRSQIHGRGLFTVKDLLPEESIGLLSTILSCYHFKDDGLGGKINHSIYPNISLYHKISNGKIYVYGKANQPIAAHSELTADYTSLLAPKPNFAAEPNAEYCKYVTLSLDKK